MTQCDGVNLHYLVDDEGFARPMWPKPKEGAVWTDGVLVLKDADGHEEMVAHYAHMKSLTEMIAHGVGVFDERINRFSISAALPNTAGWRCLNGHPTMGRGADAGMVLFPAPAAGLSPFLAVRAQGRAGGVAKAGGVCGVYLSATRHGGRRARAGWPRWSTTGRLTRTPSARRRSGS